MKEIEDKFSFLGLQASAVSNMSGEMLDRMLEAARIQRDLSVMELKPVLSIVKDGKTYSFCNEGALITYTAFFKGGKTFATWATVRIAVKAVTSPVMISHLVAGDRVGVFCSEDGKPRTQLSFNKFFPGTYEIDLDVFSMRHHTGSDLLVFTERYITTKRPKLLCIDLSSDLVSNVNNLEECNFVVNTLATLAEKFRTCILLTLHLGRTTGEASGHWGSNLLKRSDLILKIKRFPDFFLVIPTYTRDEAHPAFSFKIIEGTPVLSEFNEIEEETEPTSTPESKILKSDFASVPISTHREILEHVFAGRDGLQPKDFQPLLRKEYERVCTLGTVLLKQLQQHYISTGLIVKSGTLLHLAGQTQGEERPEDDGMV